MVSLSELCNFLQSQFIDFGDGTGCLRESPVAEPSVCYLNTNFIASYVIRRLCLNSSIADKIDALLAQHQQPFYDYHQVILLKDIPYPFRTITTIDVASKMGIAIKAVALTDQVWTDYYQYANLLFYESVRNQLKGFYQSAVDSYNRARGLFNGKGFRDKAFASLGKYETYKLALALYSAKMLVIHNDIELFTDVINSISPLTTLYNESMVGEGDLNVETASLIAIAMYSDLPYRLQRLIGVGSMGGGTTISTPINQLIILAVALSLSFVAWKYLFSTLKALGQYG